MRGVPLSEVKDALSRFLREAEDEEIVITCNGKPAGVLIGFASEDDWFDYQLQKDPRFLRRIEQSRRGLSVSRMPSEGPQPQDLANSRWNAIFSRRIATCRKHPRRINIRTTLGGGGCWFGCDRDSSAGTGHFHSGFVQRRCHYHEDAFGGFGAFLKHRGI